MKITHITIILLICIISIFSCKSTPTESDKTEPWSYLDIANPAYPDGTGPSIYLDEGHYNRHTYEGLGSYIPFKDVLIKDGYQIISFQDQFTDTSLQNVQLLVIPCAQDVRNLEPNWENPVYSAFNESEIATIKNWVENGGSLFLIVDHHPFAGASKDLAIEFGFELFNGHAEDFGEELIDIFYRANGTLDNNVITNGRDITEEVDSIKTFAGAALKIPDDGSPILTFDGDWEQWLPEVAWDFSNIESESIEGLSQGAFKTFGNGKIVVFGDASMFTAQDKGGNWLIGFINRNAKYNHKLLLNIIHWLDGLLD